MKRMDRIWTRQTLMLNMHTPINGYLSLLNVDGTAMSMKRKSVLITHTSPEMVYMITDLKLPVATHYRVGLDFTFVNIELSISGFVTWSTNEYHVYQYGIALSLNDFERLALVSLLKLHLVNMSPNHVKIHQMYESISHHYLANRSDRFNQTI